MDIWGGRALHVLDVEEFWLQLFHIKNNIAQNITMKVQTSLSPKQNMYELRTFTTNTDYWKQNNELSDCAYCYKRFFVARSVCLSHSSSSWCEAFSRSIPLLRFCRQNNLSFASSKASVTDMTFLPLLKAFDVFKWYFCEVKFLTAKPSAH